MNPFALHGPAFLAFYVVVGALILAGQFLWTRGRELSGLVAQPNMTDPYLIAYLRGGADQALNIAAVSLIDRGLLKGGEAMLHAESDTEGLARRPIEKAILRLYRSPGSAKDMASDATCLAACREYHDVLVLRALVAGPNTFGQRLIPMFVAIGVTAFFGFLKLVLAQPGHDVGLLIVLMIILPIASVAIFHRRLTARGAAMLADLEVIFARLRDRAATLRQGGATNEAALLAAVYGLDELSTERFPGTKPLRRKKESDSSCGGGSGCGGSCGGGCGGCGGGCGG